MSQPAHDPDDPTATAERGETTGGGPALVVLGVVLVVVFGWLFLWVPVNSATRLFLVAVGVLLGGVVVAIGIGRLRRNARPSDSGAARPLGYTVDGQPIYPVVGYTSSGEPITADRAVGVAPFNPRTNPMATATLVLGVVAGPLAIPFGHIARSQIARTGEQGGGMALAGLILGYISLTAVLATIILLAGAQN
jgi:hypothetical protein